MLPVCCFWSVLGKGLNKNNKIFYTPLGHSNLSYVAIHKWEDVSRKSITQQAVNTEYSRVVKWVEYKNALFVIKIVGNV